MKVELESKQILKTIHLIMILLCGLFIIVTTCSKSKGGKKNSPVKGKGKREKTVKDLTKQETEDDVKFDIKIKPVEQKRDEFDDDEENPLAKIPTKPRLPKQKVDGTVSRTSSTVTTGSKLEPEASFFAPHEKQAGASCYMVKTANKG